MGGRFARAIRAPLGLIPPTSIVRVLSGGLRGAKWIVGSGTHGCWIGTYERHLQGRFVNVVKPGNVVYDLGANVGFYTLLASRRVGPRGRVLAFEPFPRNVTFLRRHLELNGVTNVELHPEAVSDADGTARFEEAGGPSMGRLGAGGGIVVTTVRLDSLLARGDTPLPDVIKVDIEGAETQALEGARRLLGAARPVIFLALHGSAAHAQCRRILEEERYDWVALDGKSREDAWEILAFPRERPPLAGAKVKRVPKTARA